MSDIASHAEQPVEAFRSIVAQRIGLQIDDSRSGVLAELLERRLVANNTEAQTYLASLSRQIGMTDELRAVARELTVCETYFFRHSEQLRAFSEVALPARMRARAAARQLRILSAGCASGEEPYSLAMLVATAVRDPGWDIAIRGVDINTGALERAREARYSAWSLRETPADLQRRWFTERGRDVVLDSRARVPVTLEERNLAVDDPALWVPDAYDVVFCRNVLMYFTLQCARATVARIWRSLAPGGFLFLGHAETLRGLSHDFRLRHAHGTFFYARKDPGDAEGDALASDHGEPPYIHAPIASSITMPTPAETAADWLAAIRSSCDRILAMSEAPPIAPTETPPDARDVDFGTVLGLLERERFTDVLSALRELPADSAHDGDVLLVRAASLVHAGETAEAESIARELLARDELDAGAHYVLALCREAARDPSGAADHDRMAAYLDPTFAMPRLHLGLMARRAGERAAARRDLGEALHLLSREDASRLLLFGGGFKRDGLVALCKRELARLGAAE